MAVATVGAVTVAEEATIRAASAARDPEELVDVSTAVRMDTSPANARQRRKVALATDATRPATLPATAKRPLRPKSLKHSRHAAAPHIYSLLHTLYHQH